MVLTTQKKNRRYLTGHNIWETVRGVTDRTNTNKTVWRFRLGCWTSNDTRDIYASYRWVVQGDVVRCTQKIHSQRIHARFQFKMKEPQLSTLLQAIVLNPNSIIPDFK